MFSCHMSDRILSTSCMAVLLLPLSPEPSSTATERNELVRNADLLPPLQVFSAAYNGLNGTLPSGYTPSHANPAAAAAASAAHAG